MIFDNIAYSQIACDIVVARDHEVLLHRRSDSGLWALPGGRTDEHESLHIAASRELQEELGIVSDPKQLRLTHVCHGVFWHGEMVLFSFVCDVWNGEPMICEPDKCLEIGWFDRNDLPSDMNDHHRDCIQKYAFVDGVSFQEWNLG